MKDQLILSTLIFLTFFSSLVLLRIILGLRENLYFISKEKIHGHDSVIPLTHLCKRNKFFNKNWKEDVELSLSDFENNHYSFHIKYGMIKHFYFTYTGSYEQVYLNKKKVCKEKKYRLKNNSEISVGGRTFKIKLTPKSLGQAEVFGVSARI